MVLWPKREEIGFCLFWAMAKLTKHLRKKKRQETPDYLKSNFIFGHMRKKNTSYDEMTDCGCVDVPSVFSDTYFPLFDCCDQKNILPPLLV